MGHSPIPCKYTIYIILETDNLGQQLTKVFTHSGFSKNELMSRHAKVWNPYANEYINALRILIHYFEVFQMRSMALKKFCKLRVKYRVNRVIPLFTYR